MPLLPKQGASKLLKIVGGKPHASSDDHEEDASPAASAKEMTEEEINADPIDSDNEIEAQVPPPPSQTSQTSTGSKASRKAKAAGAEQKGTRRSAKETKIRPPPRGSYHKGQAAKGGTGGEAEKENVDEVPTSSAEKRPAEESIFGGMQHQGPKRLKSAATYRSNLHANPIGSEINLKRTFSKARAVDPYHTQWHSTKAVDDLDNIEMKDAEQDKSSSTSRKKRGSQKTRSSTSQPASSPAKPARPNLLETLGAYKQPASSPADNADGSDTDKPTTEALDNMEQDVAALPSRDRDLVCNLCQAPVDPSHSIAFYATRKRTVRNQALFCKEHKRTTAAAEYKTLGFPPIDWEALTGRIHSFRPQLVQLLRNETDVESEFRKQHAEKLLSGKAVALPSRRKDKKTEELEQEMFDNVDGAEEFTGFYGPRGKRIMMEAIGAELVDDIKEAVKTDPVVGRSGFAAFVQAVLVPELTILLAMEDLGGVSEGVAKEKIQKSAELGRLLHEDVDDLVARGSDEEMSDEEEGIDEEDK
ncbi:hypothetical protein K458DRAFT_488515 [Lentithecium fluviatile CBS 122367]|uniref:Restriction of telomere capping protein 4 n=1 Tax=Lentithecium fluviatile CBS 122367 TaxID=1168545 RepID=A0A6G1IWZ8_9PLEO|nr:hypothetical protein K458DRAFT_488515 [Lentithecium fluviatile CBS 122367]